jgi:hypothetical protein
MKCLYYLAPTLDSTQHLADELRAAGIAHPQAHLAAVARHFLNPFIPVMRRGAAARSGRIG